MDKKKTEKKLITLVSLTYNRISLNTMLVKSLGFPSVLLLMANFRFSGFPTLETATYICP